MQNKAVMDSVGGDGVCGDVENKGRGESER